MSKVYVEKIATLAGHKDCIYTLEKSSESHLFFSAGGDGMVAQWDLSNPEIGKLIAKVPNSIYAIKYLPESNTLLVGQNFEGLHQIDLSTQKEIRSLKITDAAIFDIQVLDKRAYIALGDGVVVIVDLVHWAVIKHIKTSDKSARSIAIHPNKQEFAVGFSDAQIRIFDINTYEPKYQIDAHENSVFTLQYSPDGKYLLSGSRDAHLKIWKTQNYTLKERIVAHMYAINHIAYHPSGKYFVTGSMDKSVKVWDAERFKLLKVIDKARYAGHGTSVNKVLCADYQNYVISGSDDRMVSVWNLEFSILT